jgi:hypothetical protein
VLTALFVSNPRRLVLKVKHSRGRRQILPIPEPISESFGIRVDQFLGKYPVKDTRVFPRVLGAILKFGIARAKIAINLPPVAVADIC